MKKLLASVLSIAIIMSFAACGNKNGQQPSGSGNSTAAQAGSSSSSATKAAFNNPASEFVKDRIENITVPGETIEDGSKEEDEILAYHIPELLIKSSYADSVNKEINAAFEKYKKSSKSEDKAHYYGSSYIAYLSKDGILSLVFISYGENDDNEYKVYNIDTKTGEKVENARIAQIAGVSDIRKTAMDALQAWYNKMEIVKVKDYKVVVESGENKDSQMKDVENTFSEKYLNDRMQIGLTAEGKIFFITTVSTMAGAEFYNWVFDATGESLDDEDNPYWTGEMSPDDEEDAEDGDEEDGDADDGTEGDDLPDDEEIDE